jgi:alpha 1,2-mannosyltransferase
MIQKSANVWSTMNRTTLHQYRSELIEHMEGVLQQGLTEYYGEGRGIVMVAGNADTLQRVKWTLKMLRSYESTLPVQIVCPLVMGVVIADVISIISRRNGRATMIRYGRR